MNAKNTLIVASLILVSCSKHEEFMPRMTFDEYVDFSKTRFSPNAADCGKSLFTPSYITDLEPGIQLFSIPAVIDCIQTMQADKLSAYAFFETNFPNNPNEADWASLTTHQGNVISFSYSQNLNNPMHVNPVLESSCKNPIADDNPSHPFGIFECD